MIFRSQKHQRQCDQPANIGGGRLTERVSSDVGGSRGLDRVERRLRAEAANIPLSNKGLCERRRYKGREKERKRRGDREVWREIEQPNKSGKKAAVNASAVFATPTGQRRSGLVTYGHRWTESVPSESGRRAFFPWRTSRIR